LCDVFDTLVTGAAQMRNTLIEIERERTSDEELGIGAEATGLPLSLPRVSNVHIV
jgi:hypothetical protein